MNKKILLVFMFVTILLILIASAINRDEYVILKLQYRNGEVVLIEKSLEEGKVPTLSHELGRAYDVNLLSFDEKILYSLNFDPTLIYSDNDEGGKIDLLNDTEFYVSLPSVADGEKVEILKDGIKIFEESIYDVGASSCRIK